MAKQDVASKLSGLEDTASALSKFLERLRDLEENPPQPLASRRPYTPEELEERARRKPEEDRERALELKRIASKYQPLEELITEHIQSLASLKTDIESMVKDEGRRSFWKGVWVNGFFFVLGSAVSAVSLSPTQVFAFFGLR
jgi:hypothetical protein